MPSEFGSKHAHDKKLADGERRAMLLSQVRKTDGWDDGIRTSRPCGVQANRSDVSTILRRVMYRNKKTPEAKKGGDEVHAGAKYQWTADAVLYIARDEGSLHPPSHFPFEMAGGRRHVPPHSSDTIVKQDLGTPSAVDDAESQP